MTPSGTESLGTLSKSCGRRLRSNKGGSSQSVDRGPKLEEFMEKLVFLTPRPPFITSAEGALCSFREETQIQNCNIYNINGVLAQTQAYYFFSITE